MITKGLANTFVAVLVSGLTVGLAWGDEPTQVGEVTGLSPSISQTVAALRVATDSYEVKCLQGARFLDIVIEDTGTLDDCFSATLIGTSPLSMLGQAQSSEDACNGTSAFIFLTRPGSEGTMKALLSVYAYATGGTGTISYTVTADCESLVHGQRNTSLVLKQNE